MLKWCGSGGVVKSDYSVSSLSEKESRERELDNFAWLRALKAFPFGRVNQYKELSKQ